MIDKQYPKDYEQIVTAMSLLSAIEDESDYTKNHSMRVGNLVKVMTDVTEISNPKVLIRAAYYHDIGKIKLKKSVLFKAGELSLEEYEEMKQHSKYGYDILLSLGMEEEAKIVLSHHERIDGSGYPNGIRDVPFYSQLISTADVFDALTSSRPYREAMTTKDALLYLYSCVGKHYDIKPIQILHNALSIKKRIKN